MRIDEQPNVRACLRSAQHAQHLQSQNAFPSAAFDLFSAVDRVYARGMNHHTLMTQAGLVNALASKVVRAMSGLGTLPNLPTATTASHACDAGADVVVIGAGPAGLAAAAQLARAGRKVLVVEQRAQPGGSYLSDPRVDRATIDAAIHAATAAGVEILCDCTVFACYPADVAAARDAPYAPYTVLASVGSQRNPTQQTLLRLVATQWLWTVGGYAVNLPFADNDLPAVFAGRALGQLLRQEALSFAHEIVLVTDGAPFERPRTSSTGAHTPATANTPQGASEAVPLQRFGTALATALGAAGKQVAWCAAADIASVQAQAGSHALRSLTRHDGAVLPCQAIGVLAVAAPASDGPRMMGCTTSYDAALGGFAVTTDSHGATSLPHVYAAGDVTGYCGPMAAATHGTHVATAMQAAWTAAAVAFADASTSHPGASNA